MNNYYPVNIRLSGKKVVIIGGGKMAERKIRSLQSTGANLEIVSPDLTDALKEMHEQSIFHWLKKDFSREDIDGAFMIIAATNNPTINQAVKDAASENQLVCLLDQQEQSDIHFPAVVQRGKLIIATSTSGASPILARKINERIANQFDERYTEYLEFLAAARSLILTHIDNNHVKKELLSAIVSEAFLNSEHRWDEFAKLLAERKIQIPIAEST